MKTSLLQSFLQLPFVEVAGWTLLHFVWQGLLIALTANLVLAFLRRANPQPRYLVACAGMVALLLAPIMTASWLSRQENPAPSRSLASDDEMHSIVEQLALRLPNQIHKTDSTSGTRQIQSSLHYANGSTDSASQPATAPWPGLLIRWIHFCLPWVVVMWCCGVLLLSLRLLAGLWRVRQWKHSATWLTDVDLVRRTRELANRMGIRQSFQLLQSVSDTVPAVIGWLRPAVIVPTSLITGLSPQELDSLLVHELAHIRRHDYLVNLLQSVVETLLFYHPAVWWISNVVRTERENCCDDVAAVICGDRVVLAKALAHMEELRCDAPGLAMSARNGSLLQRIRRILLVPENHSVGWWPAGLISLTSLVFGAGLCILPVGGPTNLTTTNAAQNALMAASIAIKVDSPIESPSTDETDIPVHKPEIEKIDPKTGQSHAVLGTGKEKILATHTYKLSRRESTGWIDVNGTGMPIDEGVEAVGVRVHVTLMQTVLAIDTSTEKVLWHLDEGKLSPNWRKVSILELPEPSDDGKLVVVELESSDGNIHRRFLLRTGKEIVVAADVPDNEVPKIQILKQEGDRIQLATIESSLAGRTKAELLRRFQEILMRSGGAEQGSWVTDQETLISAENASRLKPGPKEPVAALDAQEVIFNLPEGSGIRAEFAGEKIEIASGADVTNVVVTNGRVKLFDANGVERANASPDGGAEQLVVEVRMVNGEGQLKLRTRRIEPDADYPQPPVQVICNLATGALADEQQPPHGALRFGFEDTEFSEPARMKMRWHFDLKRLVEEAERETGSKWPDLLLDVVPFQTFERQQAESPPANEHRSIGPDDGSDILDQARALGDWLTDNPRARFDSAGFMRLAAELMALDETRRVEILRAMAHARLDGQSIVLCRMLFEAKTGLEFRRPGLGEPHFFRTESKMEHWPLEPIVLVNDVPLLFVSGYTLSGEAEPAISYLEHCLKNCDWTQHVFDDIERKLKEAETMIRQPAFWGGEIDRNEWSWLGALLKQLRPGFIIGIMQQPHFNAVVPIYLLDLETRVEPASVVSELDKRGWSKEMPITFVVNDNATLEWIERILKPVLAAGCRDFEFIRWQQSVEPVSMPELEHLLNPEDGNQVEDNRGDNWGVLAQDSGLQSRLTITSETPAVGQPLLLKLEVRNSGEKPTQVSLQNYAPFRVLRVNRKQADGTHQMASFIGMTPQTEGSDQSLAPGQIVTVWENVDATTLFWVEEGSYQIFAAGGDGNDSKLRRNSNLLAVEVQPGQLPPQQALLGELLKILPQGWTLSTGFGAIFLSHTPTDLKADVTTIQLWFTEESLPKNFELGTGAQRQVIDLIGRSKVGLWNISALPKAAELWPEYVREVRIAAAKAVVFDGSDDQSSPAVSGESKPWHVFGRVTGADGKPIAGAIVRAHTGIGSLRLSEDSTSDADGRYDFRFGQGVHSDNRQLVQAATISVEHAGHFEKNLSRQGDRIAALEKPAGELGWGRKTLDDLFLPGESKEINFVMLPAATVSGLVVGQNGGHLDGVRVSLVGDEMPPSCSVVANTKTDKGGRFELTGIPTGFKYQILVQPSEAKPPWLAWSSAPMIFVAQDDGISHLEYSIGDRPVDFGFQQLNLILNGTGIDWKAALKTTADKKLELTWDGLSTNSVVRAGTAFLELGEKPQ